MKILIIGGCGFIGSHLVEKLKDNKLVVLDNNFTGNYKIKGVKYIKGESKDIDKLIKFKPDIIYHLGEYSRLITSFEDIERVIEYNAIGTLRVVEFCRKNKIRLIYAGSSSKFGNKESPYSFIKSFNSELIKRYGKWFGLNYAIAYFYSVYGEREIKNGKYATVIGIFSENIKNKKTHIVNNGKQKRHFTNVSDIIDGLLLIGKKGKGEYCLGNRKEYSILEVAKMFGGKIKIQKGKMGDSSFIKLYDKRIKKLGWKPKVNLRDYIKNEKDIGRSLNAY
jgi:UDP-glucose 4-epimerase